MKILLVEDNIDYANTIAKAIGKKTNCELVWAQSRDHALSEIDHEHFDLILLDRKLPSGNGELNDHVEHGWRVFTEARAKLPGTPIWFLTGFEDADFASDINNRHQATGDIHGTEVQEQILKVHWKKNLVECIDDVVAFANNRQTMSGIAINPTPPDLNLSYPEKLALQNYARQRRGAIIDVERVGGGFSGSRVLKVVVRSANGLPIVTAVAKIAALDSVTDEASRYRNRVTLLAVGAFPPLPIEVKFGCGNVGGLFYGMVGNEFKNLFDHIAIDPAKGAGVPEVLFQAEEPWHRPRVTEVVTVSRIRRRFLRDMELALIRPKLGNLNVDAIEQRQISAAQCMQHNDLHCANVAFDQRNQAMLIDFGDVSESFAAIDPVSLELSTVFHPERSTLNSDWPATELLSDWFDLDRYVQGCEFPMFIRGCRQWARSVCGSDDEIAAVAYSYALRVLKFEQGTDDKARALIEACIRYFATQR